VARALFERERAEAQRRMGVPVVSIGSDGAPRAARVRHAEGSVGGVGGALVPAAAAVQSAGAPPRHSPGGRALSAVELAQLARLQRVRVATAQAGVEGGLRALPVELRMPQHHAPWLSSRSGKWRADGGGRRTDEAEEARRLALSLGADMEAAPAAAPRPHSHRGDERRAGPRHTFVLLEKGEAGAAGLPSGAVTTR
jgi:hypothetical protein